MKLEFHLLTPQRWADLERLFGANGACGGCWCMWWRLTRSQFQKQKGEGNRQALKAIVGYGDVPGFLAYAGDVPVGWCSIAPREDYAALERSRTLKAVDDQPVWSTVCFYVTRSFRGQGVMGELIEAAVDYARSHGAKMVEAYPVEPGQGRMPDAFAYTGLASAFLKAGFKEVARRSPRRPIMRYVISQSPTLR